MSIIFSVLSVGKVSSPASVYHCYYFYSGTYFNLEKLPSQDFKVSFCLVMTCGKRNDSIF